MIANKVAKNALILMLATTGQKFIAFLSFALVARLVGPEVMGTYAYSVSITSIFVVLSDLGMTPVVIRAISGEKDDSEVFLSSVIKLKFILVPIAIGASLLYGVWRNDSWETIQIIALATVAMSADAFHLVFYGVLRGRQNLKPEAIGMFIGQVLTATVALITAYLGCGALGLAGALASGSIWNVLWAGLNVRKDAFRLVKVRFYDLKKLFYQALPFAVAGIAVKIYSYVDSLMLEIYQGKLEVGYYAIAYKLTYAMQFIPLTFTAALYPALSASFAKNDTVELRKTFLGAMRIMAVTGFPIVAGLSALAPNLITMIYGDKYLNSIPVMQILPWVLLPIFLDFPIGALLNGSNRAHLKTITMVSTMFLNFGLNFILIPRYGSVGAGIAGVVSFWFLFIMGAYFVRNDLGSIRPIFFIVIRALIASIFSWLVWHFSVLYISFFGGAFLGIVFVVFIAFLSHLLTKEEFLLLWKRFKVKF